MSTPSRFRGRIRNCKSLDVYFSALFYRYGKVIAKCPIPFLVVPWIVTLASSVGFVFQERNTIIDPQTLYTPIGAPSYYEKAIIDYHWPMDPDNFVPGRSFDIRNIIQALVVLKNESESLLQPKNMALVDEFNKMVMNNHSIVGHYMAKETDPTTNKTVMVNRTVTYDDLCLTRTERVEGKPVQCFRNDHVAFLTVLTKNEPERLTWPRLVWNDHTPPLYIGNVVGNVTFIGNTTRIKNMKSVYLLYYVHFEKEYMDMNHAWETAYQEAMETYLANKSNPLDIAYFTPTSLSKGIVENGDRAMPRFAITTFVLITFSILCSFELVRQPAKWWRFIDFARSKPGLAVCGITAAGMGIATGQGLLLLCQMPYNNIICVMPFLVLSVGVNGMFIMMSAWSQTDESLPLEERFALTMGDAAVAGTITAMTDVVSYLVGIYTQILAVRMFCAYTALAIFCSFIYQITYFAACTFYAGKMEVWLRNRHAPKKVFPAAEAPETPEAPVPKLNAIDTMTNHISQQEDKKEEDTMLITFTKTVFRPILSKWYLNLIVICGLLLYLGLAIWGRDSLQQGLKVQNLLVEGNHAAKYYTWAEDYYWDKGPQVEVVVNNPPDLYSKANQTEMQRLVKAFENTAFTMGNESTDFWMREFLRPWSDGLGVRENDKYFWSRYLHNWVGRSEIKPAFGQDLTWVFPWREKGYNETNVTNPWLVDGKCSCLESGILGAFRFRIGLRNFRTTNEQKDAVSLVRSIADNFKQYNVTTYMSEYPFMDQYLIILPNTLQNVGWALATTLVVTILFIPSLSCTLWITFTIVSIDVGVLGFMTLWGVNLDAISMITILMSIGFSVDFSAHVSFGFSRASGTPAERALHSLETHGLPVIQGATATVLGFVALSTVPSYVIVTFFKTVLLVMIFGMLHACLFLPVLLVVTEKFLIAIRKNFGITCCDCRQRADEAPMRGGLPDIVPSDIHKNGVYSDPADPADNTYYVSSSNHVPTYMPAVLAPPSYKEAQTLPSPDVCGQPHNGTHPADGTTVEQSSTNVEDQDHGVQTLRL